jgi:orotate phosphoribosyltransferase
MKELFEKYGAIKNGHFKLTSGKHSNQYINKDAIYSNPILFNRVVMKMVQGLSLYLGTFDIITGPAIAGAVLAAPISLQLFDKIFVYPEKDVKIERSNDPNFIFNETEIMKFRRGYDKISKDKRVWIIEDIITTGKSVEQTIDAVEKCGGGVVGISVIWNRGLYEIEGIPLLPLINENVVSYWPDRCPSCKAGESLQDPKE